MAIAIKKILIQLSLIPLILLNVITSLISLGMDIVLQNLKAKVEANKVKSWIYMFWNILLNTCLLGFPLITKWTGKLIKKASDKINDYIQSLK